MTGALKIVLSVITALLLVASLMLVGNTIRLSIYARRREVEVMRLVGATRWFIRWPFMIEGVVVGFAGGLVAILILWLGKVTIVDPLCDTFAFLAARTTARSPSRRWSRSSSRPRCWSRRSAPASRCAASSRSERPRESSAGSRPRRALIAVLCAGIWLGGHPGQLPRTRCATSSSTTRPGSTAEATEVIEDNYYRAVDAEELDNASIQGMVRELRQRHDDRFSHYFNPET